MVLARPPVWGKVPSSPWNKDHAYIYLKELTTEYEKLSRQLIEFTSALAHVDDEHLLSLKRSQLIQAHDDLIRELIDSEPFDGNSSLRDAMIEYLVISSGVLKKDYAAILDIKKVASESFDQMEFFIHSQTEANRVLNQANITLINAQAAFAHAYGLNLQSRRNELESRIKKTEEATEYYNELFLIYFKSANQESYWLESMNDGIVHEIQVNLERFESYVSEGRQRIQETPAFNGDKSLKKAVSDLLVFYQEEIDMHHPELIDFHRMNEQYTSMKDRLDHSSLQELSKSEIERFNLIGVRINEAVGEYNQIHEELYRKRNNLLHNFHEIRDQFLRQHIPR